MDSGGRGGNLQGPSDAGLVLPPRIFKSGSAPGIGTPLFSPPSQNKKRVSSATQETSREDGYIVWKCFEILSMVSRETQAGERSLAQ